MHLLLLPLSLLLSPTHGEPDPDPVIRSGYQSRTPLGYCGNGGYCVPNVFCSGNYLESLYDPASSCYLAHGTPGVCCLVKKPAYSKKRLLKRSPFPKDSKSPFEFDEYTLNHAAKVGKFQVMWLKDFEEELSRRRVFVKKGSASFNHFAFFKSNANARRLADDVSISIFGSQELAKQFGLTPNQAGFGLGSFNIGKTLAADKCPTPPKCDKSYPYRSYNASCNNLRKPLWGTSGSPFQRTLLPQYSDGIWNPKVAKSGEALPSARLVSINIVPDVDAPSELDTHNVMQWGQFVDHDITHTPLFRLSDKNTSGIQCCTDGGEDQVSQIVYHPQCLPISIPENDPFFRKHKQRCMNFVRSLPGPNQDCTFGYAEQQNQITHLHDGSNVYGSLEDKAMELRLKKGGLMKTFKPREGKELLPQDEEPLATDECAIDRRKQQFQDKKCFKAGDSRANEQPGLTAYHTVWLREHNRLARELHYLNPRWEDEKLYQEARRILVAELQHITYNEWLPIVLGTDYMDQLDILPLSHGHSSKYSDRVNPTILNSFATAAFRFGHTLIQGMMDLVKDVTFKRKTVSVLPLSDQFLNPELMYTPGGLDKFLVGLATQPIQKFDNVVTDEVTNHLLQEKGRKFGLDLVALNLQRGREHGLQGYNAFRELCGLGKVTSFDKLTDLIPAKIVRRLKNIYDDVDDIDLFIGGISESHVSGSLLGPTFQCIVGDQFKRLHHGDRFFYEHSASPAAFNVEQLGELRKASLARVTCDNGDNIRNMQPLAFRKPSAVNPLVPCDAITIPLVNLLPWQEGHQHHTLEQHTKDSYRSSRPLTKSEPYFSQPRYRRQRRFLSSSQPSYSKPYLHRGVQTPLRQFQININYRG